MASRPASERFYRSIRLALAEAEQLREAFAGDLERDETAFGGARKGKRGWGAAGEVIVFGIVKTGVSRIVQLATRGLNLAPSYWSGACICSCRSTSTPACLQKPVNSEHKWNKSFARRESFCHPGIK